MNNSDSSIVLKSSDLKVPPDPKILAAVAVQSRRDWTIILAGMPPLLLACSLAGFAYIIRAVQLQNGI